MIPGFIAGSQKDVSHSLTQKFLSPKTELEHQAEGSIADNLNQYGQIVAKGPGQRDMTTALGASRSLADLLKKYSEGGFLPSNEDYSSAWSTTQNMFQPRQTQLAQRFQDEEQDYMKQAQRMGRDPMDVVFKNRLAQTRAREQALLGADQTQYYQQQAFNMPNQRLQYANSYAQVTGGLASQALANRQNLLSLGNTIKQNEANFRLNSADTNTRDSSGGGFKGGLAGGLAETGASLEIMGKAGSMMMGMPSGGGGGGGMPMAGQSNMNAGAIA